MKLLYLDENIALYFDSSRAIYIQYEREPQGLGTGDSFRTAPQWYLRWKKINALLQSQLATDVCTKEL